MIIGRVLSLAILALAIGIVVFMIADPDHRELRQFSHLSPYAVEHAG